MTKFAAKFGYTREDLEDPVLNRRVKERYALEHGHDTSHLDEWVMLVRTSGEIEFYPYWFPPEPFRVRNGDRGWKDSTPLRDPPLKLD